LVGAIGTLLPGELQRPEELVETVDVSGRAQQVGVHAVPGGRGIVEPQLDVGEYELDGRRRAVALRVARPPVTCGSQVVRNPDRLDEWASLCQSIKCVGNVHALELIVQHCPR
jgi:hypothetical protein